MTSLIQHFEADFLWKVSLKILNSRIILKTFTYVILPLIFVLKMFSAYGVLQICHVSSGSKLFANVHLWTARLNELTLCMLGNFSCFFCCLLTIFKINFFQNILSGTLSGCQTVWI